MTPVAKFHHKKNFDSACLRSSGLVPCAVLTYCRRNTNGSFAHYSVNTGSDCVLLAEEGGKKGRGEGKGRPSESNNGNKWPIAILKSAILPCPLTLNGV